MKKPITLKEKKIFYFKYRIMRKKKFIDSRIDLVNKYSHIYNIDRRELYAILLLEYVNRGHWLTRSIEKLIVNLFTNIAIRLDFSIGVAQIKISTAKQFYPDSETMIIAKRLLNDEFNINLCAQIINNYYHYPLKNKELLGLVKKYTTGDKYSQENISINIYYELMKWIIEESLIKIK